ncbi:MAG: peptidoglycan -binding protein [Alphaproteobacteria bacterium]
MPPSSRTARRAFDIWPGYVDALATLLILIIFVLMVFMVSQFFLSEALTGRDRALDQLNARISELSEMLSLEQDTSVGLRQSLSDVAAQLQLTISARDTLAERVRELDAAIVSANVRVLELETDLGSANTLTATLDADLGAARARIGSLESDLIAAVQRGAALESDLALASQRAQARARELEAAGTRAVNLETDLVSANERIGNLESALGAATQRVQRLRRELALANQQIALLDEALGKALKRAETGEASLATSEKQTRNLAADLAAGEERGKGLAADLAASEDRGRRLAADLAAARKGRESLESDLAAAVERSTGLDADLSASRARADKLDTELGAARESQRITRRALVQEQRLSDVARASVNLLNSQIAALRQQLASLQQVLDASEARGKDQKVRIADLGRRLNLALAEKVQELKRYRSEFFGRLHELLGDRADIRVVGDRFVFQSELLFASGSASLEEGGARQLAQLARTLKEISAEIPKDIDWVLRVDGHTDRRPIRNAEFPSNWELSTARAISVVRYLASQGIPPSRLAATGFGEFQPIDQAITPEAYRKNRRIELKLTQR